MVWHQRVCRAAAGFVILLGLSAHSADAQQRRARVGRFEVLGFDFSTDGGWRKRATRVRDTRAALLRSRAFSSLNAAGSNQARLSGALSVPVIPFSYSNVALAFTAAQLQSVLFNPAPVTAPYSLTKYYQEVSNGHLTLSGAVLPPVTASNLDTYYEDGCDAIGLDTQGNPKACGNPGFGGTSIHFKELLLELLAKVDDGSVNWGQFDNDGDDGIPNSGDDDGRVDFIAFVQPEIDGACGTTNIWAHRYAISFVTGGTQYTTKTPRAGGGFITVQDYTIQSSQGGNTACTQGQIMPIGTIAHETGHTFGLPDLYDTSGNTEGIGEWGIMGSGNYTKANSPAGFDAWSRAELGWVTLDTLTASQTVTLAPIQTAHAVVYAAIANTDEYVLIENRDSLLSDTAQMTTAFSRKKAPGLLIWHIDQSVIDNGRSSNSVNVGPIQGVSLEQADGLDNLHSSSSLNRGDAGDSYPGSTVNRAFVFSSNPSSASNAGAYSGFVIDSIFREESGIPGVASPVVFRFLKRARSVITTDRNGATVKVNSAVTTRFDDVIAPGDNVSLDVISPQSINSGRSQLTFLSWSDAGATAHSFVGGATPDTVIASFSAKHKLNLVSGPINGTVNSDIAGSPNLVTGVFLQEGVPVTLTATPTGSNTFVRWQGDTTTTNATLVLPMGRPYSLTAIFSGSVAVVASDAVNALLGASCAQTPCLTAIQLAYLDQSGNNDGIYNLGDFLAYADRSGLNPSSEVMQRALSQPTIPVPIRRTGAQSQER